MVLDFAIARSTMHPTEMLIRRLRVDTHLSHDDAKAIHSLKVETRVVPADTYLVSEGDRPSRCCLIIKGFACRSKVANNGKRQILSFHIPGDIPDLQSLFLKTMDHDLATMSPATVGFIAHSALEHVVRTHPSIACALWRETLVDAAIFREWIVNMGVRPAAARMAHLLAELRQRMAAVGLTNGEEFEFPVTQSELGEALGLSTVHVNRVLQAFRAERVLDLQKNFVTIEDYEKVVQASGFDESYLYLTRNVPSS
ncbi:Crp/Fnr family transcriptional regulator [Bradyrhizobium sp. CB1650]|uniref:Crp/Fnr family transcriptional regulator n=1 Tax=Bradyrhizobium sp. CB1650 TaxID=3039153 RepID=UPI002434CC7D|nr:Crp/Fnr family transcriptional regulator [Bradyrhizobium sp. CB1650]WGD52447.1 Crp/Fnr family transcriptional regulator [Bradyrhizobium sp. CB1650]